MTVGVVLFPGSNCEHDVVEAVAAVGGAADIVWHGDDRLASNVDAVVLPGGFAHGDYLRTGAIARFSPIMRAVVDFAEAGGPVVGICNGFQVLCEAGLLPGALQKNSGLRFLCDTVVVRITSVNTPVTWRYELGAEIQAPVNHFEGNFTCDERTLAELQADDRVVLRYVNNPNGSIDDIAGVCSAGRNVVGLMPHPERASHPLLGGTDGLPFFAGLLEAVQGSRAGPALTSSG